MEFIGFLSQKEVEIIRIIKAAGYGVEENTPLCHIGKKYFGFYKKKQKKIVICTENAKNYAGYLRATFNKQDSFDRTGIYIRRALRHESVHVAQACNNGLKLDLKTKKQLKIHPYKIEAWKGSSRLSGEKNKEYEAYTLEDKPKFIIEALEKYCL